MVNRNVFRKRGGGAETQVLSSPPPFLKRVSILSSHETEKRAEVRVNHNSITSLEMRS